MSHPDTLVESYQHACEGKNCDFTTTDHRDLYNGEYCDACFEYYYCECGKRLVDAYGSPGDGLCRSCD